MDRQKLLIVEDDAFLRDGLTELLAHTRDRTDGIDLVRLRHVGAEILLRGEKDQLIGAHRIVERADGSRALHSRGRRRQIRRLEREYRKGIS